MAIGLDIRVENKDLKGTYIVMKDGVYIETGTINHYLNWDNTEAQVKQISGEIKLMLTQRFAMRVIMDIP